MAPACPPSDRQSKQAIQNRNRCDIASAAYTQFVVGRLRDAKVPASLYALIDLGQVGMTHLQSLHERERQRDARQRSDARSCGRGGHHVFIAAIALRKDKRVHTGWKRGTDNGNSGVER